MKEIIASVKRSYPVTPGRGWGARRWEASKTHRLNQAHWLDALEGSINTDLASELATLRTRCIYEADNNPLIDGMIFTHEVDIVGPDGPELQVQSDSDVYNEWLEDQWREWFKAPTPNKRISGAALLRLWVRSLVWTCGELLAQKVTKRSASGPVAMRVKPISPRRLNTPTEKASDPNVVMGVHLDADGDPQRYYIDEVTSFAGIESTTKSIPVSPDDIIHLFMIREEDQARGVPRLAPSLPAAADLRDYDAEVLEAAHQAANQGVVWYADDDRAEYREVDTSIEMERGTQGTGPPGWKPMVVNPAYPPTQYPDFRSERQMEIGRPAAMPLMVIRLDAGRHNYSSARFDGQNYSRAGEVIQNTISGTPKTTGPLNELVDDVDREASLSERAAGLRPPERPDKVEYLWTWSRPPHVDPQKENEADRTELEMGTADYSDLLAKRGRTVDGTIAKRKRTLEKLKAAELPPVPTVLPKGSQFATLAEHKAAATQEELPEESAADTSDAEEELVDA